MGRPKGVPLTENYQLFSSSYFDPKPLQISAEFRIMTTLINFIPSFELKKKYNSKILGSSSDKNRIPGIDISLGENKKHKIGNLEFEVIFIPGHTKGHIAFFFKKEKIAFTGDTLFSLGCGRIFEGTYEQMFNSLKKIKELPKDTQIYCGHEYTLQNSKFCESNDPDNSNLKSKIKEIEEKIKNGMMYHLTKKL